MIHDNDISYAEAEVRRLETELAEKKRTQAPDLAEFEAVLLKKKRDLHDLKSRKRNEDDQQVRLDEQKKRDDRRLRPS